MEYVPNSSMPDLIDFERRKNSVTEWFNELTKARFSLEIAEGMKSLHDQGIAHKDLKSDNILLDKEIRIKICDFSFIGDGGVATLKFMSPKLLDGEDFSKESDVYAYGVTLSSLFGGGDIILSARGSQRGFRPSISLETPDLIRSLIDRCWSEEAEGRPTFDEIIDILISKIDYKLDTFESLDSFHWDKQSGFYLKDRSVSGTRRA